MSTNLQVASDNVFELSALADGLTGVAVASATVVVSFELNGTAVAGATALAMAYVTASAAYRCTIPETVGWVYGNTYTAVITVTDGPSVGTIRQACPTVTA